MTVRARTALVVDDEAPMRDIITFAFETEGSFVHEEESAEAAAERLRRTRVDVVVLDVMLPGRCGLELFREIVSVHRTPVTLLTALGETAQRIAGLEAGAADYVTKPFHPRELALRAVGVVQRSPGADTHTVSHGALVVDLRTATASVAGRRVELTPHEFTLLVALLSHPGEVQDFHRLLLLGWGDPRLLGGRELLKTAIYRLRAKLDAAAPGTGGRIRSIRGVGYVLEEDTVTRS